jgi:carbon monoxide dehydrogenase subunit G
LDIKGEYQIARERQIVWDALNDPQLLKKCIPGCESLEMESAIRLRARIMAAIGPVRSKFDTTITLDNLDPPDAYTLTGESKAGAAGFGRGSADVRLQDKDGGTLLSYDARLQVGGKLAQVGSRLVLGATRKLADDFFGNLSRELDPDARRMQVDEETTSHHAAIYRGTAAAAGLALLVLLIWWFLIR